MQVLQVLLLLLNLVPGNIKFSTSKCTRTAVVKFSTTGCAKFSTAVHANYQTVLYMYTVLESTAVFKYRIRTGTVTCKCCTTHGTTGH